MKGFKILLLINLFINLASVFAQGKWLQTTTQIDSRYNESLIGKNKELNAQFLFNSNNTSKDHSWITYANWANLVYLTWTYPERAIMFTPSDFNVSYPFQISRVKSEFYLHPSYPWDDSVFTFKIYGDDGSTVLYQSDTLRAPGTSTIQHEVAPPVTITSGNFYVAVAPRTAGQYDYMSTAADDSTQNHSFYGSAGSWTPWTYGELFIAVYVFFVPCTLKIPNGGESWAGGSNQIIKWGAVDSGFAKYRLLLSRNSGATYSDTIANNIAPTETTFQWFVPYINSNHCRTKLQILDTFNLVISEDASDADFTIDSDPPNTFDLITPQHGGWASGLPRFVWHRAIDNFELSHYELFINDSLIKDSITDSTYTLTPPALSENWHTWFIKAFDRAGNNRQSTHTFLVRIDNTQPIAFNLLSPADSSWSTGSGLIYTYQASLDSGSGLKKYQLWIDNVLNRDNIPPNQTSTTHLGTLSTGFHTWNIRAVDSVGNIRISNQTRVIGIDTIPPIYPVLIVPTNGSYIQDTLPGFSWHKSYDDLSGISHYQLQYAINPGFTGAVSVDVPDTNYQVMLRLNDTTYYWRVRAVDSAGNQSNWSSVWIFEIDTRGPIIPTLLEPIGGAWRSNSNVIFRWTSVNFKKENKQGSPFLDSPVRYIIQVDTNINFLMPLVDTSIVPLDTVNVSGGIRFFWRVSAYDLAGNHGSFSSADSFGVDIVQPTTPGLIEPLNGALIHDTTVNFVWHSSRDTISGVSGYQVQISLHPDFTNVTRDTFLSDTSRLFVLAETLYYWRVRTSDRAGNFSSWSSIWSFRLYLLPEIEEGNSTGTSAFYLKSALPNPFKINIGIVCTLPKTTMLSMCIYNSAGKEVKVFINRKLEAGAYNFNWNGKNELGKSLPMGIYFLHVSADGSTAIKKIVKLD